MFAIVAAVMFAIALILQLIGASVGPIGATLFVTAGLLCMALSLAGVGSRSYARTR